MKRVLGIVLCLATLASCLVLLSSCRKSGEVKKSRKKVEVDLSDYEIVGSENLSSATTDLIRAMTNSLTKKMKKNINYTNDTAVEVLTNTDCEILIGDVKRMETEKAKESIKKDGFIIQVFENKIVIVGSNNFFTTMALNYFAENFVRPMQQGETVISINEKLTLNRVKMMSVSDLNAEGNPTFSSIVYSENLDDDTKSYFGNNASSNVDYAVDAAKAIRTTLVQTLNSDPTGVLAFSDKKDPATNEVLVGRVNREETQAYLKTMDADQYGVSCKNGKIIVTAWNDVALKKATNLFMCMLKDCSKETGDGKISISIPSDFELTATLFNNWVTDVPTPDAIEGIELAGSQDVGDDSLLYYYLGNGVSAESFNTYCNTLKAAGYELKGENEIEDSIFRTYVNIVEGTAIHAEYAAYKHAAEQNITMFAPCIRVITSPLATVNMIPDEFLTPTYGPTSTYGAKTMITTFDLNYKGGNSGMGYIITLEDGSFVIIDGGQRVKADVQEKDYMRLYKLLYNLHNQVSGTMPSANNPIHIRAWLFTHTHSDHIDTFLDFVDNCLANSTYASKIKLDCIMGNLVSEAQCYNSYDASSVYNEQLLNRARQFGFKYIKVHTGQKFYIYNAQVEILYTAEDMYPNTIEHFNDTSVVYKFTIPPTDERGELIEDSTGKPMTMIVLGDLCRYGSRELCAMYGSGLKSDMVQVAHHGYVGCEKELYTLIAPEIVWWPNEGVPLWKVQTADDKEHATEYCDVYGKKYENDASVWFYEVDFYVARRLESVKYIVLADEMPTTLVVGTNGMQDIEWRRYWSNDQNTPYVAVTGERIWSNSQDTNVTVFGVID